jgi:hypothetical protein
MWAYYGSTNTRNDVLSSMVVRIIFLVDTAGALTALNVRVAE